MLVKLLVLYFTFNKPILFSKISQVNDQLRLRATYALTPGQQNQPAKSVFRKTGCLHLILKGVPAQLFTRITLVKLPTGETPRSENFHFQ